MYFKKLELFGFKSFADKTILYFEPGITAIVGPNGCGKSNIFDSIRWVLGEQSIKSLRGSKMEDVIFNGTDTKTGLGFAEVSVTLSNEKKTLPINYEELTITRRLFRSGESEYFINKNLVRLKDILELFMGTGIGAESYSLVEQGKIDLILSSRPEDRRLIFDEAAGVTKYKTQKKEALRRLEDTENNLLRINDIIAEVKRQIGSLERQAAKARRYKTVFDKLKELETNVAINQVNNFNNQSQQVNQSIQALESRINNLTSDLENMQKQLQLKLLRLNSLDEQIATNKNAIISIENLNLINNQHINLNKDNINELENRIIDLEKQKEQLKERLSTNRGKLGALSEEIDNLKNQDKTKQVLLKQKEFFFEDINRTIKDCQDKISHAKLKVMEFAESQTTLHNQINQLNTHLQTVLARNRRLLVEKEKINQEKSSTKDRLESINKQLDLSLIDSQNLNDQINSLKTKSTEKQNILKAIKEELDNLEKEKLSLESQKDFLNTLKLKYEEIPEKITAILLVDTLPKKKISGILAKIQSINNINSDEFKSLSTKVNFKIDCEAKFMPLDISELDGRINQIDTQIERIKSDQNNQTEELERISQTLQQLESQLYNLDLEIANRKTQKSAIDEEFNKLNQEISILEDEFKDTETQITQFKSKESQLTGELYDINQKLKENNDSINTNQQIIIKQATLKEETIVLITQLKTEVSSLNESISSNNNTLKLWEESFNQDNESFLWQEKQIKESNLKVDQLKNQIKNLEDQIGKKELEAKNIKDSLIKLQENHSEIKKERDKHNDSIDSIQQNLEECRLKIHKLQMENQQIQFQKQNTKDRILQTYKVDIETLPFIEQNFDINSCISQIGQLKEKLDSYGTVNLVAIEEFEDLKKRYEFLMQQQNDLISSKETLHRVIQKINRTARKLFTETFQKVAEEFKNYFRLLFGGGDAQLFLVDEQDPLESGIEIICRPPGKKLQNVLLLSGGEKALSAIALMFAVFKVKPSPFSVLDEIDASLDEANIDRFSHMLQEFAKVSQFIIITHNKKTITKANVMYGITMEESGVSKIVSVKFAEGKSHPKIEALQTKD